MTNLSKDLLIETNLKKIINKQFPLLEVFIFYNQEEDNFYVTIFDEKLYHSPKYQELIMKIKIEYLWANDINNYLFVCERGMGNIYNVVSTVDTKIIDTKDIDMITNMPKSYSLNLAKMPIYAQKNIAA